MNKRKAGGMSIAILAIIFVVYNLFVFLLCKPQTSVFWISYVFMLIAFAAQVLSWIMSFKSLDVETVFFGIPLMQFSIFYFVAELFASVVFMFFQNLISFRIPLLIQVLLLAIFAIFAIISIVGRDTTQDMINTYTTNVSNIKNLSVDVAMMAERVQNPELRTNLKRLSEAIRFSDPMTVPAVADLEAGIQQAVKELGAYCGSGDIASSMNLCNQLGYMIMQRNQILKNSK